MKQKGFIFEVGDLARDQQGTKITYKIDEANTLNLSDEVKSASNISAKVSFLKTGDGILVEIVDLGLELEFNCTKCGDDFKKQINVELAERKYFFEEQQVVKDVMDTFYVDLKNMEIDIADFLRQEIILHFPMIPVCSNSCKGLCPKCGANLNKKSCDCKLDSDHKDQEKPLAILKQLYNAKTSNSEEKDS